MEMIWFIIWGILWSVYFVLDGFDLGIGALIPFLGKSEEDRRVMVNAVGPFWDGNEVWLITAGGVTFAAFPTAYAVMFSTLYSPLLLLLFALIFRGVSLEFRHHVDSPGWRALWDRCFFLGSALPAILLGVAFANIFKGIPFDSEYVFHGTILTLLNPYGLLGGALFLLLFVVHGSLWLATKSDGDLQKRAGRAASGVWLVLLIIAVVFLVATWFKTGLYDNYLDHPALFIIPLLAVAGLVLTRIYIAAAAWLKAWFASALTIFACAMFGIIGLYPNIFPSSLDPAISLTVLNASSSPLTLKIMLGVVLIFVPIVIAYQTWVYFLFKGVPDHDESGHGAY